MLRKILLPLLSVFLLLLTANLAAAGNISVDIVSDNGYTFPVYPVVSNDGSYRAYLQAERNARYGIRIRNNTNRRIGLVVAVDGRNIVSGKQSYLGNTERMYVLDPYAEAVYHGWRTGTTKVNRFYFSDKEESYADAWGDDSAMGVIAVAVYGEQKQLILPDVPPAPNYSPPRAQRRAMKKSKKAASEPRAGTGFGEDESSPSVNVEFKPESYALEKYFYKYEWRETLCQKNIISCEPSNRFWPDDNYAPAPPGYTPQSK